MVFLLLRFCISILSLYTEGDRSAERRRSRRTDFNPLPLYRGRRVPDAVAVRSHLISILSLYTEGDRAVAESASRLVTFQSSPSIQRETP